jgi:hypothetical protein
MSRGKPQTVASLMHAVLTRIGDAAGDAISR